MKYNLLGKTDLRVSCLSYGASPLGSVFGPVREDDGIATVHAALDCGINLIDVSPFYGLTQSGDAPGQRPQDDSTRSILSVDQGRSVWQ